MKLRVASVVVGFLSLFLSLVQPTFAQTPTQTASALPRLVRFGGTVKDLNGSPLTGVVGITFALYSEKTGGAALWLETQNVTADGNGHYTALLGSTRPDGLPAELFTTEQARWVGVQVSGQAEQPRGLLVSAPYALKAGDAETIGGLPPSAFVMAAPVSSGGAGSTSDSGTASTSGSAAPAASSDVTTTGGTASVIPMYTTTTNIQNSILTQVGTTAISVSGKLNLPATGTATSAAGKNSQPEDFVASSYNSGTAAAVNQKFQWQAEPTGNNTASPAGTMDLLYGPGTNVPTETGFRINSKGLVTFATGQTFPGAGTITGVITASGSGLSGGGTTGTLSLKVPSAGITNAMLANSKVTVSAGTGLTGGGSVALGGSTSLGINTAVVPELGTANTFTNLETINAASTTSPALQVTNTSGTGIQISAPGPGGDGLIVENAGVFGVSGTGNYQGGYFYGASGGSYSQNDTDSNGAVAAYAYEFGTTQLDIGFWGYSASTIGVGVYGQAVQASVTGQGFGPRAYGVWGDTEAGIAVFATADDDASVVGYNNSLETPTAFFGNFNSSDGSSLVLDTFGEHFGGRCTIDVSGDLTCNGTVSEVATVDGGSRKVALNSVQSPEAWFEDAGSGQLSGGQAVVNIESVFGQTINTGVEYHVFLTPNGDCKGLYVAEKSATSFVVKELGGGTSSIAFDYRIMAKRKSFENVRLADVTKASTIRKRPVKSTANAKHLPSAQSVRKQVQEHAKRRTVARLSGTASVNKQ